MWSYDPTITLGAIIEMIVLSIAIIGGFLRLIHHATVHFNRLMLRLSLLEEKVDPMWRHFTKQLEKDN